VPVDPGAPGQTSHIERDSAYGPAL